MKAPDLLAQAAKHMAGRAERDPNGLEQHQPGAKLDAGKTRAALVIGGFALALIEVSKVGTYGAAKYTDSGWVYVPNGKDRYDDAFMRHWLKAHTGETIDPDTGLLHAAHAAWNALAYLDLVLREQPACHPHPAHYAGYGQEGG